MLRFSTLAALLLVALWLPATLHCRIEGLGVSGLFTCPTEAAHDDDAGCADDSCADDSCKVIESGQFALSKSRAEPASLPALVSQCVHCCLLVEPPTPEIFALRQDEPLSLQRTWQFDRRAALPARAPDALNA